MTTAIATSVNGVVRAFDQTADQRLDQQVVPPPNMAVRSVTYRNYTHYLTRQDVATLFPNQAMQKEFNVNLQLKLGSSHLPAIYEARLIQHEPSGPHWLHVRDDQDSLPVPAMLATCTQARWELGNFGQLVMVLGEQGGSRDAVAGLKAAGSLAAPATDSNNNGSPQDGGSFTSSSQQAAVTTATVLMVNGDGPPSNSVLGGSSSGTIANNTANRVVKAEHALLDEGGPNGAMFLDAGGPTQQALHNLSLDGKLSATASPSALWQVNQSGTNSQGNRSTLGIQALGGQGVAQLLAGSVGVPQGNTGSNSQQVLVLTQGSDGQLYMPFGTAGLENTSLGQQQLNLSGNGITLAQAQQAVGQNTSQSQQPVLLQMGDTQPNIPFMDALGSSNGPMQFMMSNNVKGASQDVMMNMSGPPSSSNLLMGGLQTSQFQVVQPNSLQFLQPDNINGPASASLFTPNSGVGASTGGAMDLSGGGLLTLGQSTSGMSTLADMLGLGSQSYGLSGASWALLPSVPLSNSFLNTNASNNGLNSANFSNINNNNNNGNNPNNPPSLPISNLSHASSNTLGVQVVGNGNWQPNSVERQQSSSTGHQYVVMQQPSPRQQQTPQQNHTQQHVVVQSNQQVYNGGDSLLLQQQQQQLQQQAAQQQQQQQLQGSMLHNLKIVSLQQQADVPNKLQLVSLNQPVQQQQQQAQSFQGAGLHQSPSQASPGNNIQLLGLQQHNGALNLQAIGVQQPQQQQSNTHQNITVIDLQQLNSGSQNVVGLLQQQLQQQQQQNVSALGAQHNIQQQQQQQQALQLLGVQQQQNHTGNGLGLSNGLNINQLNGLHAAPQNLNITQLSLQSQGMGHNNQGLQQFGAQNMQGPQQILLNQNGNSNSNNWQNASNFNMQQNNSMNFEFSGISTSQAQNGGSAFQSNVLAVAQNQSNYDVAMSGAAGQPGMAAKPHGMQWPQSDSHQARQSPAMSHVRRGPNPDGYQAAKQQTPSSSRDTTQKKRKVPEPRTLQPATTIASYLRTHSDLVLPSLNRRIVGRNFYLGRNFMAAIFGPDFHNHCPLQCNMQMQINGILEPKIYPAEWVAGSTSWYPRGLPLSRLRGREMCGARWQSLNPEADSNPASENDLENKVLVMVFQDVEQQAVQGATEGGGVGGVPNGMTQGFVPSPVGNGYAMPLLSHSNGFSGPTSSAPPPPLTNHSEQPQASQASMDTM